MPAASVIVPVRNAERTLGRTLEALAAQDFEDGYEVIVVDDASDDRSLDIARAAAVTVLQQDALGPAQARNRGVAEASGQALAFCDADCFPTPGWLAAGVRALAEAELVQGHVLPDPEAPLGPFDRTLWITSEVGLWETANLFVTRSVFERVGGFDEWLRPAIGKAIAEDVWFGWRARRAGARSAFSAEALAYHAVFPRPAREYVLERRRLRYFPALAAKMPELRGHLFYRHLFLNARTAAFDAATAGLAGALAARSPLPLLLAAPYARMLARHARRGRGAPKIAVADLAADVLSLVELAHGSVRYRALLL